jgi:hypothetical protein
MNDKVYQSLIKLCADICRRNGKKKLIWFGDKNKTLNYSPKSDEMVLTVHRWFANKSCPGDYLYNLHGQIAKEVNKRLTPSVKTKHEQAYECACEIEDKVGLDKATINYLWKYKYADDLFIKLWNAIK